MGLPPIFLSWSPDGRRKAPFPISASRRDLRLSSAKRTGLGARHGIPFHVPCRASTCCKVRARGRLGPLDPVRKSLIIFVPVEVNHA